jgi:hypothetical protein
MGRAQTGAFGFGVADRSQILWDFSRRVLESTTVEGNRPVGEKVKQLDLLQSTTRHVKPCGKQGGPPPKAKYYLVTDSEEVP